MNKINAAIFSVLGSLMGFGPALLPSYFAPEGLSSSALWLIFMGALQSCLGLFYLLRDVAMPAVTQLSAFFSLPKATPAEQAQRGVILRPMAVGYINTTGSRDRRIAA